MRYLLIFKASQLEHLTGGVTFQRKAINYLMGNKTEIKLSFRSRTDEGSSGWGKKVGYRYCDITMIALIGDHLSYGFAFYDDRVFITSFDSAGYRLTPAERNTTRTHAHARTHTRRRTHTRSLALSPCILHRTLHRFNELVNLTRYTFHSFSRFNSLSDTLALKWCICSVN